MGRKKVARKPAKKAARAKLDKSFSCPYCNHDDSVECKLYGDGHGQGVRF